MELVATDKVVCEGVIRDMFLQVPMALQDGSRAAALLQMPKDNLCIRDRAAKQVESAANGDIHSALSSSVDQLKIILQRSGIWSMGHAWHTQ